MKKIWLCICACILFLTSACSKNIQKPEKDYLVSEYMNTNVDTKKYIYDENTDRYKKVMEAVDEVNQNSDMGLLLNQDSGLTEDMQEFYDLPYVIISEDNKTHATCFRYPSSSKYVTATQIVVNDEKYNVFGVKIGDRHDKMINTMESYGYSECESYMEDYVAYVKGDVHVNFYYEYTCICEITVTLFYDKDEDFVIE